MAIQYDYAHNRMERAHYHEMLERVRATPRPLSSSTSFSTYTSSSSVEFKSDETFSDKLEELKLAVKKEVEEQEKNKKAVYHFDPKELVND